MDTRLKMMLRIITFLFMPIRLLDIGANFVTGHLVLKITIRHTRDLTREVTNVLFALKNLTIWNYYVHI